MSDVKPGRRTMYAALTRAAVLDAATTLFVSQGFDATSVDDIARLSESSKGAVYHHFSDKREIFAEVFRTCQGAVLQSAIESVADREQTWDLVEAGTHAFLRLYAADATGRALLRQAVGALGWDRVRAIDMETALPWVRATLEQFVRTGVMRPVPLDVATEMLFNLYCNAVLHIADAEDPVSASTDAETVIFAMLRGLKTDPSS